VRLAFDAAFAQLGESIEQPHEIEWISLKLFQQNGRVKVGQEFAVLAGGDLEDSFVQLAGVFLPQGLDRELLFGLGAVLFEPGLDLDSSLERGS
jgi:hypothetical protein